MLKNNIVVAFIGLIGFSYVTSCVPLDQSASSNFVPKKIEYTDRIYNQSVGAVLLYNQTPLNPPIASLQSSETITLEFDLFENASDYINIKLIHCDASWEKTRISDLQYLDEFNQFLITDYQFSENTTVNYVHYTMDLPKPKISGNYLLVVFRGSNQQDLLLTRRFMIIENIVSIESSMIVP
ncbi:MAG: type IX secretion system plug protein domain-containing protein, partial [Cyclobacteriaceae bacterium]